VELDRRTPGRRRTGNNISGGESSINGDDLAGDECGVIGGEECYRVGNVRRRLLPLQILHLYGHVEKLRTGRFNEIQKDFAGVA
jgi:hypothetical protein